MFTLSVEPKIACTFTDGVALGEREELARKAAEFNLIARRAGGLETNTVAIMRDGKVFDCFDGNSWMSAREYE
jgi:hypothetical protein